MKLNQNIYAPTVQGHLVLGTGTTLKENPSTGIRGSEPTFCFIGRHLPGHSTWPEPSKSPWSSAVKSYVSSFS